MKAVSFLRYLSPCAAGIVLSSMLYAAPTTAGDKFDQDLARSAVQSGQIISFTFVKERLMEECRCQILEAKLHGGGQHDRKPLLYEIKALTPQGQIVKLNMDAHSGHILRMKHKRGKQ